MNIALIIIGSEILDGKIKDQNTQLLAEFLRPWGKEIKTSLTVRDSLEEIVEGFRELEKSHELIVSSGGLGPTKDDLTKEALALYLDQAILFAAEAKKISEENYTRQQRSFPGENHCYCYLPQGVIALSNSVGFAPGLFGKKGRTQLICAPGVPREFGVMIKDHLTDLLKVQNNTSSLLEHVVVRTKNVPEEKIFKEVDPELWSKLESWGEVSSLPKILGVDIGVKVWAKSREEMNLKVSRLHEIFQNSPVKNFIWSYGKESLEERILALAREKKITFGFAESATGGLCSHRITAISGSSQSFMGSVVCYDERVKENLLGVKKETLLSFTAVSEEVANEMARGAGEKLKTDIAISITGIAGPGGGTVKNPVGTVFIGVFHRDKPHRVKKFHFLGDRELLKERFSQVALYELLSEVEGK